MSTEIKFSIVISGYIRETEDKLSLIVPDGIKKLILDFYPKKINYVGIFLKENAGHRIEIQQDQLSFNGYRAAKLDKPLPISLDNKDSSIIFRWRAVIEAMCEGSDAVIFGVVSNRCDKFHAYPYGQLKDQWGISMRSRRLFLGCGKGSDDKYIAFQRDEIICMEYEIYNGNEIKLSFYNETKENEFIYSMNLPNDNDEITNWYPVFSKPNNDGLIKVIPYE